MPQLNSPGPCTETGFVCSCSRSILAASFLWSLPVISLICSPFSNACISLLPYSQHPTLSTSFSHLDQLPADLCNGLLSFAYDHCPDLELWRLPRSPGMMPQGSTWSAPCLCKLPSVAAPCSPCFCPSGLLCTPPNCQLLPESMSLHILFPL